MIKIAAAIGALLVFFGFKSKAPTGESTAEWEQEPLSFEKSTATLDDLYQKYGLRHNLDWRLLKAIAQVESNENPNAKNPNDPSYGLMQILCQPDGAGGCKNNLNVMDWPPPEVSKLYDPEYSLHIGAQILAWNISRYGLWRGVACYNHWGARLSEPDGPFPNQGYVDKVKGKYRALGGL